MIFEEKVADAFQLSSAALVKFEKAAREQKALDDQVAAAIPSVVDTLVRFGRIEPDEKEACARALTNPVQTLELMKKLAAHRSAAEDAVLGQQVDKNGRPAGQTKQASDLPPGGYVGRRTGEKPESWRRFEENLGLGR